MKISKIVFSIALAGIILGMGSCSMFKKSTDSSGIVVQYKLPEGQELAITSEVVSKIETEQMGQTMTVDMSAKTTITNNILQAGDQDMKMEMEFTSMTQSMESPMGSQDTDFSELLGKKVNFKLNLTGEISEEEGFDDLPSITTATGETMDGEMFKRVAGATFPELPGHPVKLGDSWTNSDTTDIPLGGGVLETTTSLTYLVTEKLEIDGMKCLRIDITGKSTAKGEFQQQGMDMAMERNTTSAGHMIFAYEKGMYVSQELTSTSDGIIDIPAAGMTIPQKITSTTKTVVTL